MFLYICYTVFYIFINLYTAFIQLLILMQIYTLLYMFYTYFILSRVGDRPTATIMRAQFHVFKKFLEFLLQNIRPKYAPPRRTNYTLKWRGGEAAPPV